MAKKLFTTSRQFTTRGYAKPKMVPYVEVQYQWSHVFRNWTHIGADTQLKGDKRTIIIPSNLCEFFVDHFWEIPEGTKRITIRLFPRSNMPKQINAYDEITLTPANLTFAQRRDTHALVATRHELDSLGIPISVHELIYYRSLRTAIEAVLAEIEDDSLVATVWY